MIELHKKILALREQICDLYEEVCDKNLPEAEDLEEAVNEAIHDLNIALEKCEELINEECA